jgi:DnaJ-like protein
LSTELGRAYEVLGVKPGVSDRELKAAHRDLAKVWHPDRFLHDPRLREKAQEKLKEINEAYEQLISRNKRRYTPPPPTHSSAPDVVRVSVRPRIEWHWWIVAPLLVFAMVFAVTTKTLLRERQHPTDVAHVEETTTAEPDSPQKPSAPPRNGPESNLAAPAEVSSEPAPTNEAVVPLATVTVSVDPETGLLATPDCPVKTRMTYPVGSEPRSYCNVTHIVKTQKENRIKGLAKHVRSL